MPRPVGQQQLVLWPPRHLLRLPLGAGPALGHLPLWLPSQGCSAVRAGTWLGTKGGSISGDLDPLSHTKPEDTCPTVGHSSCPSPLRMSLPRAAWV